jgi:hypothetical protein
MNVFDRLFNKPPLVTIEAMDAADLMMDSSYLHVSVLNDSGRLLRDLEFSAWETFDDGPPQRIGRYMTADRVPDEQKAKGSPGGRASNGRALATESALLVATFRDARDRWWIVRSDRRRPERLRGASLRRWRAEAGAETGRATVKR